MISSKIPNATSGKIVKNACLFAYKLPNTIAQVQCIFFVEHKWTLQILKTKKNIGFYAVSVKKFNQIKNKENYGID